MLLKKGIVTFLFFFSVYNKASYNIETLNKLVPSVQERVKQVQKALFLSWDGLFLNLISGAAGLAHREPAELECVHRFKIISKATEQDVTNWAAKQNNSSVTEILGFADGYNSKTSLIMAQNKKYSDNKGILTTLDQAFERIVQAEHFDLNNKKQSYRTSASQALAT